PRGRPSALESGDRAAHWRPHPPQDTPVQRLRRAGGQPVRRHGPADQLLSVDWLKRGLFLGALAPLASIVLRALTGGLDANPIAQVENELGLAALILLIASLGCTPLRRLFGWTWAARIRRELGLLAFLYAGLHV